MPGKMLDTTSLAACRSLAVARHAPHLVGIPLASRRRRPRGRQTRCGASGPPGSGGSGYRHHHRRRADAAAFRVGLRGRAGGRGLLEDDHHRHPRRSLQGRRAHGDGPSGARAHSQR
jgi:hypothetical protein